MVPWLTMLPVPLPLNERVLPFRLASLTSSVEATRPPTLTCAPCPNTMPFGLIRNTCPLAFNWPRIWLPLVSKMRLTAIAEADGCTKSTVSCGAMLKVFQSSDKFWLPCLMVVVLPDWLMVPVPDTTCPPVGPARANGEMKVTAVSDKAAAASLRRALLPPLPRPRVISATATQEFVTRLHTRR